MYSERRTAIAIPQVDGSHGPTTDLNVPWGILKLNIGFAGSLVHDLPRPNCKNPHLNISQQLSISQLWTTLPVVSMTMATILLKVPPAKMSAVYLQEESLELGISGKKVEHGGIMRNPWPPRPRRRGKMTATACRAFHLRRASGRKLTSPSMSHYVTMSHPKFTLNMVKNAESHGMWPTSPGPSRSPSQYSPTCRWKPGKLAPTCHFSADPCWSSTKPGHSNSSKHVQTDSNLHTYVVMHQKQDRQRISINNSWIGIGVSYFPK